MSVSNISGSGLKVTVVPVLLSLHVPITFKGSTVCPPFSNLIKCTCPFLYTVTSNHLDKALTTLAPTP